MHIADGVIWLCSLRLTRIMTLWGRFKSHSEIAALLSAVGGFSYLIMWIRVTDLCTYRLQHYLVRWAALFTWWFRVGSRDHCTSQYTVLCTMWYTVKFTVYCVVYSTVYCWFAHSPPKQVYISKSTERSSDAIQMDRPLRQQRVCGCRLHRKWHV